VILVSVIIPAYNCAPYISETLDSVLNQSFQNYEIVVVNDGSEDTAELKHVLESYGSRIRYIEGENRGPAAARNTGVRETKGEFLAFLDSDDIWFADFIAEQLRFFDENPSADMVCADCVFFGAGELQGRSWQSLDPIEPPVTFEKILPTHGGAFASFSLLRRSIVEKAGLFDERLRVCEDYNYWLRLLHLGGKLAYSSKILGKRRVHAASLTYDAGIVLPHAILALEKLATELNPVSREADMVRREIATSRSRLASREGRRKLHARDYNGAKASFAAAHAEVSSIKFSLTLLGLRWFPACTRWAIMRRDQSLTKQSR
jgi:glycosyltransferase involved in cell wall biosynthesis